MNKIKLLIKPDQPNINGLTFTKSAIDKAFKKYKEQIKRNKAYGTIGYVGEKLPLDEAAFRVKEIRKVRNKPEYEADISFLRNDNGKKLKKLLVKEDDCKLAMMMYGELSEGNKINKSLK